MPKLSVIVPVYNTEKYLRECIDSILAQVLTDFELILVNDGSTDNSGVICDEYAKADSRIRVIHQKNSGVNAARRQAVALAKGEYISFVDSDDWISENMLYDMLEEADRYSADIVICDLTVDKETGSTIVKSSRLFGFFPHELLTEKIYPTMLFDFSVSKPGLSLNLCNKIIKRNVVRLAFNTLPNDITYGEDTLACLICLLNSSSLFIMENSPFYHYRQASEFNKREQSISLFDRLSELSGNMQLQLSCFGFDIADQLCCYMAQVSIYFIRQILLFNKELTMKSKLLAVRNYVNHVQIRPLLERAEVLIHDKNLRKKLRLVNKGHFTVLLACFYARELLLSLRGYLTFK